MSAPEEPTPPPGQLVQVLSSAGVRWKAKIRVLGATEMFVTSEDALSPGSRLTLDLDGVPVEAEVTVPAINPQGAYVRLDNAVLLDAPGGDTFPMDDSELETGPLHVDPAEGEATMAFVDELPPALSEGDEVPESTLTIRLGDEFASTLPGTPGQGDADDAAAIGEGDRSGYPELDLTEGFVRFSSLAAFRSHYDEYLKSGSLVAAGRRLRRGKIYRLCLEVPGHPPVPLRLRVIAAMAGRVGFLLLAHEHVLPALRRFLGIRSESTGPVIEE